MSLDEIRKEIDRIDLEIRELLLRRLDCSRRVAEIKMEDAHPVIYRPEREKAILGSLGSGMPDDIRACYVPAARKIIETSRMHQYDLLCDALPDLFGKISEGFDTSSPSSSVTVTLTRPDVPGSMASILGMIGDRGFDMQAMKLLSCSEDGSSATFELTIAGDISSAPMRSLLVQLCMESTDFSITDIRR